MPYSHPSPKAFLQRVTHVGLAVITLASFACVNLRSSDAASPDALEILEAHCVRCHSGPNPKGGLDLTTRERLLRGGESGEGLNTVSQETSLLLRTVRHEAEPHMPYKQPKLSDTAIATITQWVTDGANYSRSLSEKSEVRNSSGFVLTESDRLHWSFQPVVRVQASIVQRQQSQGENSIDPFVVAKLEEHGLSLAPHADMRILIRRITLDLTGLPPTPDEIDEFLADQSPCATERLIDRLLASPHYGERWGRHWLDLARYAETDGYEHDAVRPHSWRYRDYVIKSFNEDKPYDRFIREQLAGDELWPHDPDAVTATGFNLLGPDMVDSSDQVQRRHNTLNDMTDTVCLAFLGLTIGCARCHDHKFEPLSQHDYYSLQAFFAPVKFEREKLIPTAEILAAHESAQRDFNQHPKMRELATLEAPIRERLFQRKVAQLSGEAQSAHRTPAEQRTSEQANLVLETADKVKISDKEVGEALGDEQKREHARLQQEVRKLPRPEPLPKAMALGSGDDSRVKTFVLYRGEYTQPKDEVSPGFPEVIQRVSTDSVHQIEADTNGSRGVGFQPASAAGNEDGGLKASTSNRSGTRLLDLAVANDCRRARLANWIASRQNPLTARVMVNRIWQHHFGRGLVPTSSDFGTHGQAPTHPELLDWLASEFNDHGWSFKQMHRLMLSSATYRQSSALRADPVPAAIDLENWKRGTAFDPENQLYWHMNRLRLEGEAIRDSLLAISCDLNPTIGGPGVFPSIPKELFAGSKGWSTSETAADRCRRSVYIFARRNLRFPFLEVFDAPDNNLSCPIREASTTAPQSLTLLNANEVEIAAKKLAIRAQSESKSTEGQIERAFRLTLGRLPKPNELLLAREFLAESPFNELCRALLNLNEFIYVE